jgi:hypothetical protein
MTCLGIYEDPHVIESLFGLTFILSGVLCDALYYLFVYDFDFKFGLHNYAFQMMWNNVLQSHKRLNNHIGVIVGCIEQYVGRHMVVQKKLGTPVFGRLFERRSFRM